MTAPTSGGVPARRSRRLAECTWPELDGTRPVLVVPVGSCEQHGPHLPLDTDTRVAVALAEAVVGLLTPAAPATGPGMIDALVAPAIAVSASGEHGGFPGTLSLGSESTAALLVELVRSADWAGGVVLVNGHGGNADAVRRASEQCRTEGRRVHAWWPSIGDGDAHAGRTETSLLLALAPDSVRFERREAGRTEPLSELLGDLRRVGVRGVSGNGVLGDPTSAGADEGRALFTALVDDLFASVVRWWATVGAP